MAAELDLNRNFIQVINKMKEKLKEESRINYKDGDFILMAFGWCGEIQGDVALIKAASEGFAEINCTNAYSCNKERRLCIPAPAAEWAYLKDAPRHLGRNIFTGTRREIINNAENCTKAARYFDEKFPGLSLEQIRNIAVAAAEGIDEKFGERKEFLASADRDDHSRLQLFGLWANILIFAQTGEKRPAEQKADRPAPNIYLASKGEIEGKYAFEERTRNADRQILVNYASTSFILNKALSDVYDPAWELSFTDFVRGKRDIHIVLTCPYTFAERDAVQYKMKPKNLKVRGEEIILSNLQNLQEKIKHYPDCKVKVYLTDVAMPCGYFLNECSSRPEESNIKVDLYLSNFGMYQPADFSMQLANPEKSDAEVRQSFVIYNEGDTVGLFRNLRENISDMLNHAKELNLRELSKEALPEEIMNIAKEFEHEQKY